jgi:predicted ferric reductase
MTDDRRTTAFWIGAYLLAAALPLALMLVGPTPPARGFWIEFGVALGFVGFAMLGLQFALTARFRSIAAPFGLDTLLHFHRQAGIIAFLLVLAHPLILIAAAPGFLEYLDPRSSIARAGALWAVLAGLVFLIGATLLRRRLGVAYELWRVTHGIVAVAVVLVGIAHALRVAHYVATPWKRVAWTVGGAAAIALLVQARLLRPLEMRRKPYTVTEVRREAGRAWTLTVVPEGHAGMPFTAGQFAWLTLGPSPFSLEQHPFSFSSSALRPERLEFTVKELGDWTSAVGAVAPGTRAFLEGPYGAFVLRPEATGAVFVAGGVGITPVLSILRTLRDAGDNRPLVLVYGTGVADALFGDELERLAAELELRLVRVVEEPEAAWTGATGRITPRLLDEVLDADARHENSDHFVCGPEAMMNVVEAHLMARGVPLSRLHSERFEIA